MLGQILPVTSRARTSLATDIWYSTYFPVVTTGAGNGAANASAINASLLAAKTAGGGTVAITAPGTYLLDATSNSYSSGRKYLLDMGDGVSYVTLFIGPGVVLKMSDSQQVDGAPVDLVVWRDATNIRITGGGTITGNTAGQSGWTQSSGENGTKYGQVTPGCILRGFSSTSVYGTYESDGVTIDGISLTDHFGNAFDITGVKNFSAYNVYAENCGEGPQLINCARFSCDFVRYIDTGTRSSAVPSATDTGTDILTFGSATGWTTGSNVQVSATGGGLTAGTTYWYRVVNATTGTLHATQAGAVAGTGTVNLTGSISATLTATNRTTEGDGLEFADCVYGSITNCVVDGYIVGSAYDFAGCKNVSGSDCEALKCQSGFDGSSPSGFVTTSDGFAFSNFVFKSMYGVSVLAPAKGRCTFTNFQILDCTSAIGIQVGSGEAGDDGLASFIGCTVNGCTDGLLVQLATAGVNRKVNIVGGSYSGNTQDGIRLGYASTAVPDVLISGVTCTGNGRNGITLDSQGSAFTPLGLITGCDCTGNTTAGIRDINGTTMTGITIQGCIPCTGTVGVLLTLVGLEVISLSTNTYGEFGTGTKNQRLTVTNSNGGTLVDASAGGANNVRLVGGANYVFDSASSSINLIYRSDGFWYETSRADF